jgi:hypothetical protein
MAIKPHESFLERKPSSGQKRQTTTAQLDRDGPNERRRRRRAEVFGAGKHVTVVEASEEVLTASLANVAGGGVQWIAAPWEDRGGRGRTPREAQR